MGPIIGMSPDKKAESPGMLEDRVGLRGLCGMGTLPEAECASSPLATSLDRASSTDDEELTNLNWLHENLLQNFTLCGPEAQASPSPLFDIEGDSTSLAVSSMSSRGGDRDSLKSKPPFSFSLLIYMAIEQSPSKSLPVKDIYGWILEHFPYFSSAPTGWKNSVRHNLSLNKCFRKVEKSLGKVNGKGSLWCVDPEYRPNLIQALKKQHFPAPHGICTPPASPPSAFSPSRNLLLQGCSLKGDPDSPMDLSQPDSVLVSSDPKQDHNYSSSSFQCCSSRSSSSSSSPSLCLLEEGLGGGVVGHSAQVRRAGSEGFHSDDDSEEEHRPQRPALGPRHPATLKCPPPCKRACREARPELDEELKEAAGSLLHLAGIRSCLDLSKRAAMSAKCKKTEKYRK
ncbi:forkhead box protein N2 isoform X2 [Salminus brasiliensis]|uniref:forkhead box protein N2 isoform X2 n=1 Tax=Salminus brasiliensis TaxID=930266 RepID=UPI003B837C9A